MHITQGHETLEELLTRIHDPAADTCSTPPPWVTQDPEWSVALRRLSPLLETQSQGVGQ